MSEAICITAVALDSPHRDRAHARGRDRQSVRRRDARRRCTRTPRCINGGGIRAGKTYEPGARITHGDILAELPFNNRVVVVEIAGARAAGARWRTGCRCCRARAGAFRRSPASRSRSISRATPGSRITAMQVGGAPLDERKIYRVAVLDFLARGGDDYTMFRDAKRITPDNDAPLLVNEVVEYLRTDRDGREHRASRGAHASAKVATLSRPPAARPRSPCRRSAASRARRASPRP